MTQKEKAKAYDELFAKAKQIYNKENDVLIMHTIEDLFPELVESEDERIKKELISFLQLPHPQFVGERKQEKWIAWLEKQNSDVDNANKEHWRGYREGKQEVLDKYAELEKQGESKNDDKVKPKFKVGDWVTNGLCAWRIDSIDEDMYYTNHCGIDCRGDIESIDKEYHLWTIQDAKDGDVLYFNDSTIVIFKDLYNATTFHSYCHIEDGIFDISKDEMPDWWEVKGFQPATKEQRNLLFQKMKEAGYEWDAENLQLTKILHIKELSDGINIDKQKLAKWSEEDENMLEYALDMIEWYSGKNEDKSRLVSGWLKSLKDRYSWMPSDEQMKALHDLNLTGNISYVGQGQELINLYNDLKKLTE